MFRTSLAAAAAIIAFAAAPASTPSQAQTACPITSAQITSASTSTSRVPRMGAGSDLLTQSATIANPTDRPVAIRITLNHRAFQQNFVVGQSFQLPAQGSLRIDLGNVLKPGIPLNDLRASTIIFCG